MTRAYEIATAEITTMRQHIKAQKELLEYRRNRKTGARISQKGKFVYSTQESLQFTRKAEEETARKKAKKRPELKATPMTIKSDEDDMQDDESSESEGSCIIVVARRE